MIVMETERLLLREYTMEDYDAVYAVVSDPETMQHYPKPYDAQGARRWLEWSLQNYREHGFGWWALIRKDTGEYIGDCGLTLQNIDGESLPEIGYHLHKTHWRQGFGSEAAKAVRDWVFANTAYDRVYSYMTAGNTGSWKTAEAMGMKRIGAYMDGHYGETYIYAIDKEEWAALQR